VLSLAHSSSQVACQSTSGVSAESFKQSNSYLFFFPRSSPHKGSFNAPPDLLGCDAWKEVLLRCSNIGLGDYRRLFHRYHDIHGSFIQIRRCLPRKLPGLDEGFLGSTSCNRWYLRIVPNGHVSSILRLLSCNN
jgi:hypothetical protein